jgi:hypothetical protein
MSNANAVLVNKPGPLPISFEYTPHSDVAETIAFSGSVSTHDIAALHNGFELKVNGDSVGKSIICSGQEGSVKHQATVATMVNYDIPFVIKDDKIQPVTIELIPATSDSETNKDDFFNVTIFN